MANPPIFSAPVVRALAQGFEAWQLGADVPAQPWVGGVTYTTMVLLTDQLAPVFRALELAGYSVEGVALELPDGWVNLNFGSDELTVSDPSWSDPAWPAAHDASVYIDLDRRSDVYGDGAEFAITFQELAPHFSFEWENDPYSSRMVVRAWSDQPIADRSAPFQAFEAPLATLVAEVVRALAERWEQGDVTPQAGSGLLWIFDPTYWRAHDVDPKELESVYFDAMDAVGRKLVDKVGARDSFDATVFLDAMVSGGTDLQEALHAAPGIGRGRSRNLAARLFEALAPWYAELSGDDPDSETSVALDEVLSPSVQARLPQLGWMDALCVLFNASVFTSSVMLSDELVVGGDEASAEEAIEVTWDATARKVTLTVWKDATVTLWQKYVVDGATLHDVCCWEWVPGTEDGVSSPPILPILIVVASPGVEVTPPAATGWTFEFYRVQDHELVPDWGTTIRTELLEAPYTMWYEGGADFALPPQGVPGLHVTPLREGGYLMRYPVWSSGEEDAYTIHYEVKVKDRYSAAQRISFDPHFMWVATELHTIHCVLTFWLTDGITINATHDLDPAFFPGVDTQLWTIFWVVPDDGATTSVHRVPPPGTPLGFELFEIRYGVTGVAEWITPTELLTPPPTSWTPPSDFTFRGPDDTAWDISGWYDFFYMAADIAIGMIPVFGDIADAGELAWAIGTGTDKWGRPVTNLDLVFMTAGVALPFVSSGLIKGLGRPAGDLGLSALRTGGSKEVMQWLARAPQDFTDEAAGELLSGSKHMGTLNNPTTREALTKQLSSWGEQAAKHIEGETLELVDLMGDGQKGLTFPELEQSFRRWQGQAGNANKTPADWAPKTRGRSRALLEVLLGPGLGIGKKAKKASQRGPLWPWLQKIPKTAGGDAATSLVAHTARLSDATEIAASMAKHNLTGDAAAYARRIDRVIERITPPTGMDADTMKRLVGTKSFHVEDFHAHMVVALKMLGDEVDRAKTVWPDVDVDRLLDDLLEIDGTDGFFRVVLTHDGYEHGARFEMYSRLQELAAGFHPSDLRHQVRMLDNLEGPDGYRVIEGIAQLLQEKSYKSLSSLTRASKSGEILTKLQSDIVRMGAQGFKTNSGNGLDISREIIYRIDMSRLKHSWRGPPDIVDEAEIWQVLEESVDDIARQTEGDFTAWLELDATKALLGLDPDDNFSLIIELL